MATKRNIGAAQAVAQVDTITIGGTVTASTDTVTVTCDNKAVKLTCGATMDTTAEVAAGLAELLIATQHDEQYFTADMTGTAGGYEYPQFRDLKISVSGSVVTLQSATPGWTFAITVAKTGTFTATHGAEDTVATGPWHFNAAANWAGGVAPATGDTLVFDEQSHSVCFALNNTVADLSIERRNSFLGDIGLPAVNATHGTMTYPEYRQRMLDLPITITTGVQNHIIGERNKPLTAAGHTFLDLGIVDGSLQYVYVYDAADYSQLGEYAVEIAGGNQLFIEAYAGNIGVGLRPDDTATEISAVELFESPYSTSSCSVTLKSQVTFESPSTVLVHGQNTLLDISCTSANAALTLFGGKTVLQSEVGSCAIRGGATVKHLQGDMGATTIWKGGMLDASEGANFTIASLVCYAGYSLRDHARATYTTGIDFVGCTPADGLFDVTASLTWTPTAL